MSERSSESPLLQKPSSTEVPIRRNRNFQLIWIGSAFTFLGREITDLVYPLIVLGITGSPGWAGIFAAVQTLVAMVFGIPGGELTDRYNKRRLLLLVETVRALSTATIPLAMVLGTLTMAHLLAVAVVVGAVQPLGAYARMLLVREVVPPNQLTAALAQEEIRSYGASLAGPPIGGALYGVATAIPVLTAAINYALSFLFVVFVRPPAEVTAPRPEREAGTVLGRLFIGLTTIWGIPALRKVLLFTTAMNLVSAPLVLVVVVILQRQGNPPGVIGLATVGLAIGGLAGAGLVVPLHRRFAPGTLMLCNAASLVVLVPLLAVPAGPWFVGGVLLATAVGVPTMRVLVDIVLFRQAPDDLRGRVVAAAMTVYGLGASVGLFCAGLLMENVSARSTMLALSGGLAVVFLSGLASRGFRTIAWPVDERAAKPDTDDEG